MCAGRADCVAGFVLERRSRYQRRVAVMQGGDTMRSSTRVKAPDTAKKSALAELAAKKARADKARNKKRCALALAALVF